MTLAQLKARLADQLLIHTCKYGHGLCSNRPLGWCADEQWQRQCNDETDEQYDRRMEENDFLEVDDEGTDSV